jgi:putative addiction module antidote
MAEADPWRQLVKITILGNAVGIVLPKEILNHLHVEKGDSLYIIELTTGIHLTPYDEDFAAKMETAKRVMRKHRDVLRKLAEHGMKPSSIRHSPSLSTSFTMPISRTSSDWRPLRLRNRPKCCFHRRQRVHSPRCLNHFPELEMAGMSKPQKEMSIHLPPSPKTASEPGFKITP